MGVGAALALAGTAVQAAPITFGFDGDGGDLGSVQRFRHGTELSVLVGERGDGRSVYQTLGRLGSNEPFGAPIAGNELQTSGDGAYAETLGFKFDEDVYVESITFAAEGWSGDTAVFTGLGATTQYSGSGLTFSLSSPFFLEMGDEFTITPGNGSAFYIDAITVSLTPTSAVPIPAAAWLFGSALAGIVGLRKRKA